MRRVPAPRFDSNVERSADRCDSFPHPDETQPASALTAWMRVMLEPTRDCDAIPPSNQPEARQVAATPRGEVCDERYVRNVAGANDTGIDCAYLRLMTSHERKGHTMNRTAVILGVAAAMGVFASAAAGSTGQSEGLPIVKSAAAKPLPVLRTQYNSQSGLMLYRFGDRGLWMG